MIVSLRGRLVEVSESTVVLEVQGVGYELNASSSVLRSLPPLGQEFQAYTFLHVREDALTLFAFSSWEERRLFEKLMGVAGIGPKSALAIVSSISPAEFVRAVHTKDLKTLTKLPGVGKKTGERILLELKDAFRDGPWPVADTEGASPASGGDILDDAVEALLALGYNLTEAKRMVEQAQPHLSDEYDLQELLKVALAQNGQQRGERVWRRKG